MKLLNVLIREILLFLDFKDIQESRLHLVNKQFYHNIVEDNELIRRMFRIRIPLALDYEKERQFHLEITTACKNLEDEELKQLVILCITGVSHGKDTKDLHHLLELFKFVYKSNPSNFEHNDILETLVDDANIPRDELEEELQMYENPERAIEYKVDLLESLLNKEINEKVIFDSIKFIDHTNCNGTESLHSSLLNECKIIEFDTSPYDVWIRQNLFILRKIEGFGTNRFDTPTSSFAVLVHDFPMNCEDHPLSLLIKNIYQLFNSKPKLSKVMNQGTDQDEKNKNLKTTDLDDFSQLLQKSSNAGLIPDIIYSNSRLIEFDQKFYSSKFDPKHSNEEQKLDFSKSGIAEETEKVARLYEELETEMEYYRLRLAWIGYNLQDLYSSYKYEFKETVAGRFVTFLAIPKILFSIKSNQTYWKINKQFFHIIVEDNELVRRILPLHLQLIFDYEQEREHQIEIIQADEDSQDSDSESIQHIDELKEIKLYEGTEVSFISTLTKLHRESRRLYCVAQRSTGVFCITGLIYAEKTNDIFQLLKEFKAVYKTNKDKFEKHQVFEILGDDPDLPVNKMIEDIKISKNPKTKMEKIIRKIKILINIRIKNKTIYRRRNYIGHTQCEITKDDPDAVPNHCKIVEYDISSFNEWTRQNLFALKRVEVAKTDDCTCPLKAFAILVHDFPMDCEDHPLTSLIKKIYELSEWINMKPFIDPPKIEGGLEENKINKEENNGDMSDIGEEFDFFYKLFHKNSKAGFIPNISSSMNQWMEFDQTFYSSKFDPKYDNEEQKFDFSLSGISVQDSDKVAELYDELDEEMDYYRLRLAAIAYDLSTLQTNYQFIFKQLVAGRFVTILGLDVYSNRFGGSNFDVPNIKFYGHLIPSILQFQF